MGVFEGVVVFVMAWWLVLLPILSAGRRSQADAGVIVPGSEPSAPENPALWPKLAIATAGAAVITLGIWLILHFGWLDFIARPT
jgi:predicted secreted protein